MCERSSVNIDVAVPHYKLLSKKVNSAIIQ